MAIANISKRTSVRASAAIAFGLLTSAIAARDASAVPTLQINIEAITYDAGSEPWLTMSGDSRPWVVGAFNSGQSIQDARLSTGFVAGDMATGPVSLAGTTTGHGGVTDGVAPAPSTLPYSHDPGLTSVPEPSTLLALGAGLSLLGGVRFARRRRKA